MNRKTKRTVTLLFVVLLCLISTCVLAVIAFYRSRQVRQMEPVASSEQEKQSEGYDLFWSGDETLLTRGNVVVFDIRYTDMDKEILVSLARSIEEEIQNKGIQPIFLGAETESELRSNILKSEDMDLYIGVCVGRDEHNPETFGTMCFYNDAYYVPDYNNVWLCDRLLKNVVTGISGKALGMESCKERDIMVGLKAPSGLLQIGYQTSAAEGEMLQEPEYLRVIAQGIVETVEEYYEGE